MNTLLRNVLLAFAQFERDMIVERTSEGKAIKRAKGELVEGRKVLEVPEFGKFLEKTKKGEMTVAESCRELGISRSKWYSLCKGA
jgi:DNA invertase Pin-like site-specific DNA recombinase